MPPEGNWTLVRTYKEPYDGNTVAMIIEYVYKCDECGGTGYIGDEVCPQCEGKGKVVIEE